MTVKDLIAKLETMGPERVVVLSRDEEGNGYELCRVVETGMFGDGEVGLEAADLTPALRAKGYGEEDVKNVGQPCVCLWP